MIHAHEILELFAEAATLGGSDERKTRRDPSLLGRSIRCGKRVWTYWDYLAHKQRLAAIDRQLRARRARKAIALHVVVMPAYQEYGKIVAIHLPPQAGERVRDCPCGGYLERRAGATRLQHVGPRGCREKRTA